MRGRLRRLQPSRLAFVGGALIVSADLNHGVGAIGSFELHGITGVYSWHDSWEYYGGSPSRR